MQSHNRPRGKIRFPSRFRVVSLPSLANSTSTAEILFPLRLTSWTLSRPDRHAQDVRLLSSKLTSRAVHISQVEDKWVSPCVMNKWWHVCMYVLLLIAYRLHMSDWFISPPPYVTGPMPFHSPAVSRIGTQLHAQWILTFGLHSNHGDEDPLESACCKQPQCRHSNGWGQVLGRE